MAPLIRGNREGVLRYQHFSVVMNPTRRMAYFTATNIDGRTYVTIDRETGLPGDAEGREKWFEDDRIDPRYTILDDFYAATSKLFDRGHLTRRTDPTWGSDGRAVRANADTYHWTNCTPQHWEFNQSTRFWQGVERYYLEYGAVPDEYRLAVLQGPVFTDDDETDPAWGNVRVPLSFWKIVVRVQSRALRATGLVVSQKRLLEQRRERRGRPPGGDGPPQVDHFRTRIRRIEAMTGLSFGPLAAADTHGAGPEGAEAADERPVRDWSNLD